MHCACNSMVYYTNVHTYLHIRTICIMNKVDTNELLLHKCNDTIIVMIQKPEK